MRMRMFSIIQVTMMDESCTKEVDLESNKLSRGRPRLSEELKRQRKEERQKGKWRIELSTDISARWKFVKAKEKLKTNEAVAELLLDLWEKTLADKSVYVDMPESTMGKDEQSYQSGGQAGESDPGSPDNPLSMSCESFDEVGNTSNRIITNNCGEKVQPETVLINTKEDTDDAGNDGCKTNTLKDGSSSKLGERCTNIISVGSHSDTATSKDHTYVTRDACPPSKLQVTDIKYETNEALIHSLLEEVLESALMLSKDRENKSTMASNGNVINTSVSDGNLVKGKRKPRQEKYSEEFVKNVKKAKVVKLDNDTKDGSRRLSSRLQSKGFRVDYAHFAELTDVPDLDLDNDEDHHENKDIEPKFDVSNEPSNDEALKTAPTVGTKKSATATRKQKVVDKDPDFDPDFPDFDPDASDYKKNLDFSYNLKRQDEELVTNTDSEKSNTDEETNEEVNEEVKEWKLSPGYIKSRKLKLKKIASRVKVTLADHKDKFYEEAAVSFRMKDRAKSEKERTTTLLVCALCKQFKTENKTRLEIHIEGHLNNDYTCKHCDGKFNSLHDKNMHIFEVHNSDTGKEYQCVECLQVFNLKQVLREHLATVHKKVGVLCKFCFQMFRGYARLREHYLEHHKDKLRKCSNCNEDYVMGATYKIHRRYCLRGRDKIACEICGKQMNEQSLRSHVSRVHENMRIHNCTSCSYSACSISKLRMHIQARHTGEHSQSCDQCDFTCVQPSQLVSHQRTHTGEKPYKCDKCSFTAAWNVQLKVHKKLHGLPRTVTCEMCGVLLKNDKYLNLHKKKEHKDA